MAAKMTFYNSIDGLNRALRKVPKAAANQLRAASVRIGDKVAQEATQKAQEVGGPLKLVAPTIKASRDRVPVVKMGSTRKLSSADGRKRTGARQTIGDLIWGAEFGGRGRPTTQQFQPHLGQTGYALWPTVREMSPDIREEYAEALLDALEDAE